MLQHTLQDQIYNTIMTVQKWLHDTTDQTHTTTSTFTHTTVRCSMYWWSFDCLVVLISTQQQTAAHLSSSSTQLTALRSSFCEVCRRIRAHSTLPFTAAYDIHIVYTHYNQKETLTVHLTVHSINTGQSTQNSSIDSLEYTVYYCQQKAATSGSLTFNILNVQLCKSRII